MVHTNKVAIVDFATSSGIQLEIPTSGNKSSVSKSIRKFLNQVQDGLASDTGAIIDGLQDLSPENVKNAINEFYHNNPIQLNVVGEPAKDNNDVNDGNRVFIGGAGYSGNTPQELTEEMKAVVADESLTKAEKTRRLYSLGLNKNRIYKVVGFENRQRVENILKADKKREEKNKTTSQDRALLEKLKAAAAEQGITLLELTEKLAEKSKIQ